MRKLCALFALVLGSAVGLGVARAESTGAVPSNLTNLSSARSSTASEQGVAVDPNNPSYLYAATNDAGECGGSSFTAFFTSHDGGITWASGVLPVVRVDGTLAGQGKVSFAAGDTALGAQRCDVYSPLGDPSVSVDGAGHVHVLVFAELTQDLSQTTQRSALLHFESTDRGATYHVASMPVAHDSGESGAIGFEDVPDAIVDLARDALYVAWTHFPPGNATSDIYFRRLPNVSTGNTAWDVPRRLDSSGATQYPREALGASGELFVLWDDNAGFAGVRSTDGGVTFGAPVVVLPTVNLFGYVTPDGWQRIGPGAPMNGIRIALYPALAADLSTTPTRGRLYLAWQAANPADTTAAGDGDIFFARLDPTSLAVADGPRRVNDDTTLNDQFEPALAVSPVDGSIDVLFYDRRSDPANVAVSTTLATSTDGGTTFPQGIVANTAFDPTAAIQSGFDPALGDYLGMVATAVPGASGPTTRLTPLWAQALPGAPPGVLDTLTLSVTGTPAPGSDGGPAVCPADALAGACVPGSDGSRGSDAGTRVDFGAAPGDRGGSKPTADGGHCFVATAAYGDYDHPYVLVLRDLRDHVLAHSRPGRAFIAWYYQHSPPLADWERRHPVARAAAYVALLPVVVMSGVILYTTLLQKLLLLMVLAYVAVRLRSRRRSRAVVRPVDPG